MRLSAMAALRRDQEQSMFSHLKDSEQCAWFDSVHHSWIKLVFLSDSVQHSLSQIENIDLSDVANTRENTLEDTVVKNFRKNIWFVFV